MLIFKIMLAYAFISLVFSFSLLLIFSRISLSSSLILSCFIMLTDPTKIVCWNCRGVSSQDTTSRIFHLMKKIKPIIFYLVETRADDDRINRFYSKLGKKWNWVFIIAEGLSGGIIVIWNKNISYVTPMARSRYALHLVITINPTNSWIMSIVYNSIRIHEQCVLWNELSCMTSLAYHWRLQQCCLS